ncbi:MAG TPA: hypothetical protein VL595_31530 [Pseudonocardia sp.]|jgi:hypothetical protein|nr:hypothetical protein [Pseudonocardia sp.]
MITCPLTEHRPGIPGAPVDMAVSASMEAAFTIVCGLPAILVLALTARAMIRDRNFVMPVFLLGGIIGMFVEPILDYMGGVWWPFEGSWEAFNLLGVNVPLLVVLVYPWLLGGQGYWAYRSFEMGITTRGLWQLVAIFAVNDIVLETIGIKLLGVYGYFGTQPLNFWGLPLWYVPCNAIGPVVAGALAYVLRHRLTGIRRLAAAPLFPIGYLGTYAAIGFPVWISLNSGWPMATATAAGLATFGLGYLLVLLVAEITGTAEGAPAPATATNRELDGAGR